MYFIKKGPDFEAWFYFDRENSRITGVTVQGLRLEKSVQSGHAHFLKTISIS